MWEGKLIMKKMWEDIESVLLVFVLKKLFFDDLKKYKLKFHMCNLILNMTSPISLSNLLYKHIIPLFMIEQIIIYSFLSVNKS